MKHGALTQHNRDRSGDDPAAPSQNANRAAPAHDAPVSPQRAVLGPVKNVGTPAP
jgi:hypothetical protein